MKNSITFGKTTTAHDASDGVRRVPARFANLAVIILAAAVLAALTAAPSAALAESAVSVLCYHTFIEKKKMDPYSFTIDELNSHIMQLKKEGFRFVSVGDILGGRISGTKNVLISVDDGNKSVYEAYHKVFRPNGIRPLLAIYPNIIINKKKYALTWEQLKELAEGGCDIAAHGYFHLKVNRKLYDKNPGYFKKEILLVKKVLEENLKRKITLYVYPFGLRDDTTIGALKEAGYRYAFTIDRGRIDVPLTGGGDIRYELPRYMVTRTSWHYCFDRVMKNARPKVSYRVAVADVRETKPLKRADAAGSDPVVDPSPDQVEWIYSAALHETGLNARENPGKGLPVKKKIGKIKGIGADARHASENGAATDRRDGGIAAAFPAGRAVSGARHEASVFDPAPRMTGGENEAAPAQEMKTPDPADKRGAREVLSAGMEKSGSVFERKMKARYNDIILESSRVYHTFLGKTREKIERIRSRIRRYVVANF